MDASLSKVCLFTTLMLLELQGSRRAVDISWLISKVGCFFWRFIWFCDCWLLEENVCVVHNSCGHFTQNRNRFEAAWSGGVCLHESYVTMHHGFSLWHWMVCDLVRRRRKLMVCWWSNELPPYCLFFWGGRCFSRWQKMTNDKLNVWWLPVFGSSRIV